MFDNSRVHRAIIYNIIVALLLALSLTGCGFFQRKPQNLENAPVSVKTHKVVKTAYAQMGKRYRPGGQSPKTGFDCSGLVWWSYGQHGVQLPRISSDQAKTGRKVSQKAARPGDIVVFRTSNSPRGLHTGIYAGEGKFIHSPGRGKYVCMESWSQDYWKNRLVSIRRVGK